MGSSFPYAYVYQCHRAARPRDRVVRSTPRSIMRSGSRRRAVDPANEDEIRREDNVGEDHVLGDGQAKAQTAEDRRRRPRVCR